MAPKPDNQANPVVTSTGRSSNGNFQNIIEGGMSKELELAARMLQGMLLNCMDSRGNHTNPSVLVKLAFKYADALIEEEKDRDAAKLRQVPLEASTPQPQQSQSLQEGSSYLHGPSGVSYQPPEGSSSLRDPLK